MMRRIAALAAVLSCSACLPVVQHGPWIRPGVSGTFAGGAGLTTDFADGVSPYFTVDGALRVGIETNDSLHTGASLGVQLPLLSLLAVGDTDSGDPFGGILELLHVDGYFTGPMVNDLHTAAGLTASRYHVMPYIQAGRYDQSYASLAVMFVRESDVIIAAPSFTTVRREGPGFLSTITLTAGVGRGESETVFLAGLTFGLEFHRKNASP